MDSVSCFFYLKKILPDLDVGTNEIQDIVCSKLEYEKKVQKILSNYFKNRASKMRHHTHRNALKTEARYIHKLYPSLTFQYIYDQLDIFGDMPNRREIVLRIIVHAKDLENSNDVADAAISTKRASPHKQSYPNNMNNNQPAAKTPRLDFEIPLLLTSQPKVRDSPKPYQVRAPFAYPFPIPEDFAQSRPHLRNGLQDLQPLPFYHEQNAISSTTNAESNFVPIMKPITSTVTSTVTKPATITSAATSIVTSSDIDEPAIPNDTNVPGSSREPFNYNTLVNRNDYEIPDIMEHFDLPVIDAPVAAVNCPTASTEQSSVIIEVKELITSPCVEVNIAPEYESTSSSIEELNNAVLSIQEAVINQPAEQKRDSQDSNQTEIYSPPREMEENEKPVAHHYTVNLLSPTFIRIKQTLIPEQYQNENEVFDGREQQNINIYTVASEQNNKLTVGCRLKRKLPFTNEPPNNLPSTSKQEQVNMNTDNVEFNLIEYVHEITNASKRTIRKHCKRLHISTKEKPENDMLNVLVDNIFSITVDSENSDIEDYHDFREVENAVGNNEKPESVDKTLNTDNLSVPSVISNNPEHTPVAQSSENSEKTDDKNVKSTGTVDTQLVNTLCSIFPEACPTYVRALCRGKVMNDEVLDGLITTILNTNNQYPKRPKPEPEPEVLPENQLEILQEFLPDADPDYLRMMCDKFEGKPHMVKTFLNEAMEKRNYPTKKDYLRRQQLSAQQKQYTTEFNVENFMKLIPDPHTFFSDPSRKLKLNTLDSHYALVFLRNYFNKLPIRIIQSVFTKSGGSIFQCMKELKHTMTQSSQVMKSVRRCIDLPNTENIPLLQEIAYYSHEKEINAYLKDMKEKEEAERQAAKDKGLMKTCNCCYDDEVLPRDMYCCENGCEFCKSCIVKSSEVRFGEGKLDFPCLMNCPSFFTVQTLQAVLSPKLFSKVAQKKALEEIKAAGIEELEQCPFCDFATIPAEGYNIFTCMNPECMKESCRMCKEPSHIPLRCEEIEKDADVKARTFVENKMTEALLRKCYKCGIKFFKEEGCNKMTCSCGAQMCYVCGKAVTSYKHFNGNGGDRYDLCPLYSDTNVLNKENVLRGAEEAKAEIGTVNLKHDPAADLDKHFKERNRMFPQVVGVGDIGELENLEEVRYIGDLGDLVWRQPVVQVNEIAAAQYRFVQRQMIRRRARLLQRHLDDANIDGLVLAAAAIMRGVHDRHQ